MGGCGSNNLYGEDEAGRKDNFVFHKKMEAIPPPLRIFLKSSLLRNPSFHETAVEIGKATDADLDRMIDLMEEKVFHEGSYVCGSGNDDDDDCLGVILSGECRLSIDSQGNSIVLKKGNLVGDILFLVPKKNRAPGLGLTQSLRVSTIYRLKKSDYDFIMGNSNVDASADLNWSEFLTAHLTPAQINELQKMTQTVRFSRGDVIIKRGDQANDFYLVFKGMVKATVDLEVLVTESEEEKRRSRRRASIHDRIVDIKSHSRVVGEQGHFGEHSLITGKPQPYFVVAMVDVALLKVPAYIFNCKVFAKAKSTLSKHVEVENELADTISMRKLKKEDSRRSPSEARPEARQLKSQRRMRHEESDKDGSPQKSEKKIFAHMREKEREQEEEEDSGVVANVVSTIMLKGILY